MLEGLLARFEEHTPVTVLARVALEHAMNGAWVDEVFETHRQRQYSRELLFSTVVDLMSLVCLGLSPSLHAAAKKAPHLPVSVAALYDKIRRTEPAILRALVQGAAQRLQPVVEALPPRQSSLPGWQLRIVDGNHLPASEKRLAPLREQRGAALPGHSLVVYDPDHGLVTDWVACEDAHAQERAAMPPLVASALAGQLWIADRNFCTSGILQGWQQAQASFIVREHARHPRLAAEGPWQPAGPTATGQVFEQSIHLAEVPLGWRRIELRLDTPLETGENVLRLWSNLPAQVSAQKIAELYRKRWTIEGMFQRLESVLHSEIRSLGHPRAALLGFAVAVLAYNVLSLLKRSVEQAHPATAPQLEVSTYYLAQDIRTGYEGMLIALPPPCWRAWSAASPAAVAQHLLHLARHVNPQRVATHKRSPKSDKPKEYVDGATARAHFSTSRVLKQERAKRP